MQVKENVNNTMNILYIPVYQHAQCPYFASFTHTLKGKRKEAAIKKQLFTPQELDWELNKKGGKSRSRLHSINLHSAHLVELAVNSGSGHSDLAVLADCEWGKGRLSYSCNRV